MSADNWTVCPKCGHDSDLVKAQAEARAKAAYGKVSAEEYLKLLADSKSTVATRETLREDYELGVDKTGIFEVSYACFCADCGFAFNFVRKVNALGNNHKPPQPRAET